MTRPTPLALVIAAVVIAVAAAAPGQEGFPRPAQPSGFDALAAHLEFAGYTVTRDGASLLAKHPTSWNISIKEFQGSFLVAAFLTAAEKVREDRAGFLELINLLNTNAKASRYYADKDSDLAVEAWYPGSYEKARFAVFLDTWKADVDALKATPKVTTYMK